MNGVELQDVEILSGIKSAVEHGHGNDSELREPVQQDI
jgi:hypothetical protein